ncbi:hypothetical protein ON010_g12409 [Phytophthora cinnamomi]|nr:hypothetical protein ON010_g12409 [Phytophthora cinnamomi]
MPGRCFERHQENAQWTQQLLDGAEAAVDAPVAPRGLTAVARGAKEAGGGPEDRGGRAGAAAEAAAEAAEGGAGGGAAQVRGDADDAEGGGEAVRADAGEREDAAADQQATQDGDRPVIARGALLATQLRGEELGEDQAMCGESEPPAAESKQASTSAAAATTTTKVSDVNMATLFIATLALSRVSSVKAQESMLLASAAKGGQGEGRRGDAGWGRDRDGTTRCSTACGERGRRAGRQPADGDPDADGGTAQVLIVGDGKQTIATRDDQGSYSRNSCSSCYALMSSIPDYGGSLPKKYKSESVGDIKELGIKKLFRMVILGPSFSGKNNMCYHILKLAPHVFSHPHIIARNPHQELYDYLRDKLEGFITFHETPPQVDAIGITPGNKPELVIIDDYSNDKSLQKNVFSHYFTRGRHHKLSTIFQSHSCLATDKMIRLNTNYMPILRANSRRDLKLLITDFNIPGLTEEAILHYCNRSIWRGKGQMLFIDSVKGQIRYNFDQPTKIGENY